MIPPALIQVAVSVIGTALAAWATGWKKSKIRKRRKRKRIIPKVV